MQTPSEYLRDLIARSGGMISVERFMQEALYHPQFGYYANRVRRIGKDGDFSTSATLHTALPRALAAWTAAHRAEVLRGGVWHVIELGGGGGQMAEGFLSSIGWFKRRGLRYHLVEISKPLQALQRQRLARFGGKVHWHTEIAAALDAADGQALILSNEFVDAFPCVQLCRDKQEGDRWSEVAVAWPETSPHPTEVYLPWQERTSSQVKSSAILFGNAPAIPNRRVEIHYSYLRWLEGWTRQWKVGRMLTVDYGDLMPAIYDHRPRGSLRAYAHHQRIEGPAIYQNFGQQDLTADVNFTDLQEWGTTLGLKTEMFCTQAEFLRYWLAGALDKMTSANPALAFLVDEAGAGTAFKVLEQVKTNVLATGH